MEGWREGETKVEGRERGREGATERGRKRQSDKVPRKHLRTHSFPLTTILHI